jgi:hypothetical protein
VLQLELLVGDEAGERGWVGLQRCQVSSDVGGEVPAEKT